MKSSLILLLLTCLILTGFFSSIKKDIVQIKTFVHQGASNAGK